MRLMKIAIFLLGLCWLMAAIAEEKAPAGGLGAKAADEYGVTYLGKPVSEKWVDLKFKQYRDKCIMIGTDLTPLGRIDIDRKSGKVVAVLMDGSCLLEVNAKSDGDKKDANSKPEQIHIMGLSSRDSVDGKSVTAPFLVKVGTFVYTTDYTKKTVNSYDVPIPVTIEQFEDFLKSGKKLPRITGRDRRAARTLGDQNPAFKKERKIVRKKKTKSSASVSKSNVPEETSGAGKRAVRKYVRPQTFQLRGRASPLANAEISNNRVINLLVGSTDKTDPRTGKACYRFDFYEDQKVYAMVLLLKDYDLSRTQGVRLFIRTDVPQNEIHVTFKDRGDLGSPDIHVARYTRAGSVGVDWTRVDIPIAEIRRTGWKADKLRTIYIGYQRGVRKTPCSIYIDDIEAILP